MIRARFLLPWLPIGIALQLATSAFAAPPNEGECPTLSATPDEVRTGTDAAPIVLKEGMSLDQQAMLVLRHLVPQEIWRYREVFFFEGMHMEVGHCHRRYPDPPFYREATEKFAGKVELDDDGDLENYVAGIPFPPESISASDPQAGIKWAWNMVYRFRGGGHRGRFRVTDIPSGMGGPISYEGDFFFVQGGHRADLAAHDYQLGDGGDRVFSAGGELRAPFDARGLAWRQFRNLKSDDDFKRPDDTFVYVPSMRKSRRAATPWVDGLFFPRVTATGDAGGGGLAFGGGQFGSNIGAISPTASQSIAASEHMRRGFAAMTLRPNAYVWRVNGETDVLAPLNSARPGYPVDPDRNYGPSGLSLASDRWDVRRAVIIEGALRVEGQDVRTITIYLDYQTRQPLYWITRTGGRRYLEVGVLASRWTSDWPDYPNWPGGIPTAVFEPVAEAHYNALAGGGGWRRESYDMLSTPVDESELRVWTSSDNLGHGH